jgi:hypothetical protein
MDLGARIWTIQLKSGRLAIVVENVVKTISETQETKIKIFRKSIFRGDEALHLILNIEINFLLLL